MHVLPCKGKPHDDHDSQCTAVKARFLYVVSLPHFAGTNQ